MTSDLATEFAKTDEIPSPLPEIVLPGNGVTISESARKLFELLAPSEQFFVRDRAVLKLVKDETGTPALEVLKPEAARSDFEKHCRLAKTKIINGNPVTCSAVCSTDTAKGLLSSQEALEFLPKIKSLINCPVIYDSAGELKIAKPGYDAQSERLVTGGEAPEQVDFLTARSALLELLAEFDFQSDGDKARAVASLVAPALKLGGFLKYRVPADVAEANESQAGKGYRQKIIAAIYNEKIWVVTNRQGGVGSIDESFSYQLLQGHPFIQFDNLRGKLDSQMLEAFFTADGLFQCRTPYHPIVNVPAENYFIFLTSNGVETTRDMANRSAIIRIRKRQPGFTFRKYDEGDLLAHVHAQQPFYLGCVFSVIREWHRRGKQTSNETRHDFKEWVQTLDWIVRQLFGLAPLMEGHQAAQILVSNPNLVFLRHVCLEIEKAECLGEPQSAQEIAELCEAADITIPGPRNFGDPDQRARQVGTCFRSIFDGVETVDVEAYEVKRSITQRNRDDGKGLFPMKTYIFTRSVGAKAPEAALASKTRRVEPKPFSGGTETNSQALTERPASANSEPRATEDDHRTNPFGCLVPSLVS